MRDIFLFTSKPMDFAECEKVINASIRHVVSEPDINRFRSTSKNHWYFTIENGNIYDEVTEEDYTDNPGYIRELDDWAAKIPVKDPYINRLESYRSIDVKRLVAALVTIYPDLYVNVDDDNWYGTAQEYIDTEFDY